MMTQGIMMYGHAGLKMILQRVAEYVTLVVLYSVAWISDLSFPQ